MEIILITLAILAIFIAVLVAILRWALRINDVCRLLADIRDLLKSNPQRPAAKPTAYTITAPSQHRNP